MCTRCNARSISARAHGATIAVDCTACHDARAGGEEKIKRGPPPSEAGSEVLQKFLKSEVERVQGEIESALAGIKIIVDTIAPWKNTAASNAARGFRGGPAANIEGAQQRR
jgi:hypothetical protein